MISRRFCLAKRKQLKLPIYIEIFVSQTAFGELSSAAFISSLVKNLFFFLLRNKNFFARVSSTWSWTSLKTSSYMSSPVCVNFTNASIVCVSNFGWRQLMTLPSSVTLWQPCRTEYAVDWRIWDNWNVNCTEPTGWISADVCLRSCRTARNFYFAQLALPKSSIALEVESTRCWFLFCWSFENKASRLDKKCLLL